MAVQRKQRSEYLQRRAQLISPERVDPFADQTPAVHLRSYGEVMKDAQLTNDEIALQRNIKKKQQEEEEKKRQEKTASKEQKEESGDWDQERK